MDIDVSAPLEIASATDNRLKRSARILVVDDVAENRDVLHRRLARRGFEVLEAANGRDALRIVGQENIDLVLLDIMMPEIDGTEVVREIRKSRSRSQLPIIMVSANSMSEDVAQSIELGANDYVTKPVDFPVALARIQTQIERKHASDELARKTAVDKDQLKRTRQRLAEESSSRKRWQERLEYLAFHDDLTGLMNRVGFRETLQEALASPGSRSRNLVLLFIDLDRFKSINDIHGHEAGDELLQQVGVRLTAALGDAIAVARLGGDEFAALVAEDDRKGCASAIANSVVTAMRQPFARSALPPHQIAASVGLARAELADFRADTLMKAADLAMYRAKAEGRGRVAVFEPSLLDQQRERSSLEVGLHRAIDLEEFVVYYQPLMDATTKTLSCFEALVRWRHPEKGLVSPGVFIPLAEEAGLIHALGSWVLRRACADAATWPQSVRLAVNLSPAQFRHPDLISTIVDALHCAGIDPNRLEVEITESCLLDAGDKNIAILHAIRELGVHVAIDDFGTGYSSMSYLQKFTFDKLKIDRQFVSDVAHNNRTAAIMDAIVQLGTSIGISTTAEGVETEEQLAAVISHGCSEVQGYLLAAPMPASEATNFVRARSKNPTLGPLRKNCVG